VIARQTTMQHLSDYAPVKTWAQCQSQR